MTEAAQVIFPRMRDRAGMIEWADHREKKAPLFGALNRAIAADDELFELSQEATEGQLCGRMLLSAVHFLLIQDPRDPLAAYFPSLTDAPLPAAQAGPAFKDFCRRHREAIVEVLHTRTLQTTNTDRAARVLLALDHVGKAIGEPFALVEVGCSAGLLLLFEHYRYEFDDGNHLGSADAATVVSAFEFEGKRPPMPTAFPQIGRRVGLDLTPIRVEIPEERDWILACVVADMVDEFAVLRRALDHRAAMPLELVAGDAMDTLPEVLKTIEGPVCVLHSWCLYQWSVEAQDAFSAMLGRESMTRPIHRIGIEQVAMTTERSVSEITYTVYDRGRTTVRVLGKVRNRDRIEWLA